MKINIINIIDYDWIEEDENKPVLDLSLYPLSSLGSEITDLVKMPSVAMHCSTYEQVQALFDLLNTSGRVLNGGTPYPEFCDKYWKMNQEEDMCVLLTRCTICSVRHLKTYDNYTLLEANDYSL